MGRFYSNFASDKFLRAAERVRARGFYMCCAAVVLVLFCFAGQASAMSAREFYRYAKKYKCQNPFAATVQSAHETANWTSELWVKARNGAGIKADKAWRAARKPVYNKSSVEHVGSRNVKRVSAFRKYSSTKAFLKDYTENMNPQFDYESKTTYAGEFESTRQMFLLLGGALSFIVGLVGVLNFFNAILTGITARRRELAVLQSIGMTARQLRTMLALEGLLYTVSAALLALALVVVTAPFIGSGLNGLIWFFTYRFTVWPIAAILPLFTALGILIPVLSCRAAQRYSVVERLRQE